MPEPAAGSNKIIKNSRVPSRFGEDGKDRPLGPPEETIMGRSLRRRE